mmetsp:Transcript_17074/g.34200  ORF Transcript_17074/g.34200 Transcript_17074/m.34200 type:complete len:189 (+) Transcript_17074:3-569(+)
MMALHWDEVSPSSLVKSSENCTADIIHAACYSALPSCNAIIHLHTPYAVAVGCLSSGFLGLTQDGSFFHDKIATHEWEGVSDDPSEGPRIAEAVRKVGDKCNVLLMPNHGFCCFGGSVAEAWVLAYYFEKACQTYILASSAGQPLKVPPSDVMAKSAAQNYSDVFMPGSCEWAALCRQYEREYAPRFK